jgi:putative tricarboxylic transport membrane protein
MDRRIDLAGSLVISAFGLWVLAVAVTYPVPQNVYDPFGPMGIPALVGGLLLLGGVIQSIRTVRAFRATGPIGFSEGTDDEPEYPSYGPRAVMFMAGFMAYILLIPALGYFLATPLGIAAGLWLLRYRTWWKVAIAAIGFTLAAFLTFDRMLRVPLPTGLLTDLLVSLGIIDRIR